ncbi:ATP cone domain-containing protein [Pyrobaculum neutrophilum]|uniref:ATP-cone domain protein n=1 Tax=Pyrobaculum neutrophilum (strain DSM 2338 / JCM 9278 / NBRC 100436 / V24Sta) TaxID=444157 RepID=B1YDP3_PYRNV|nr:ATP cone domain-containing protein [Pyrobaculum neutrophilum]ACB39906.1 ATP-cone domain protein [Pyrobaculum neutrophilum V24Sta]
MVKVVKRDGRTEEFIPEKIVVSVLKAGAPVDVARKIARKVECAVMERENVTAQELTRMILAELKKANEQWYRNWIVFDQAVKRRRTEEELR